MVESRLDVGGAVTFWALADWSDRTRLEAAFASIASPAGPRPPGPARGRSPSPSTPSTRSRAGPGR
jgi:hypothetical protein